MASTVTASANGERAWENYQEIVRVVDKRYQLSTSGGWIKHGTISLALQRLGEATRNYYNMDSATHPVTKKWNLQLHPNKDRIPPLSTLKEMLTAKIVEWEDEIPSEQVGPDVYTDGRTAAYRPQPSLEEVLEEPFYTARTIIDMTFAQALEIFERINRAVGQEIGRLKSKDSSEEKVQSIENAMKRLYRSLAYKYGVKLNNLQPLSKEIQNDIDATDLYSVNTMFNARIGDRLSVRQALNLSTDSWPSRFFGLQEAWWGKTTSLDNVEQALLSSQ